MPGGQAYGSLPKGTGTTALPSRKVILHGGLVNGATLQLVADTAAITNGPAELRKLLLIVGVGTLIVTGIVLIVTIRFALRPLDIMASLARSIALGNRGGRLSPTRTDTELGRTAEAFDDMVDALEGAEKQARIAEFQAKRAEAAARRSEERTRRFVADAAHELRTPIAGVQAVAEAVFQLPQDGDVGERERLQLLLVRESRRAGHLVDDLLDLARIDAGVDLNIGPVALHALAEADADRTRLLAPELTVAVSGLEVTVPADHKRITQILANLMDNARQATPKDGQIDLTVRMQGKFGEIEVMDSGTGVPEADRERIFDRLVRLDAARDRRSGGSGLGLAIARGFARAHGGNLTCVAPPPGRTGAVFRLLLPMGDNSVARTEPLVIGRGVTHLDGRKGAI
jgi:signal transduction histidine kinase